MHLHSILILFSIWIIYCWSLSLSTWYPDWDLSVLNSRLINLNLCSLCVCLAWSVMSSKGWRSKGTLYRARDQLVDKGFIVLTRQGGMHKCSLYGVTWKPIDECNGKLDLESTRAALGTWKSSSPWAVLGQYIMRANQIRSITKICQIDLGKKVQIILQNKF